MEKNEKINFYDLPNKLRFQTNDYKKVTRANRRFAVAKSPKGIECWRIIKKK